ncbi:MAG TPA: DEAD/DEAH box helicase family protein [Flavobacteriales bacterium]|nr:DEAD/DEAH box helicase family protein [Flavobacteriales bacterium]
MNRHVNAISGRLSLRKPQRDSLEILGRITELMPPGREVDMEAVLKAIQSEYPSVTDFEREFPSLCFALATGVGKTRLMGAFISYLHLAHGINNFFVLAPGLTVYDKLIADFTPNTRKYVFQGIGEFAVNPPHIITGDNYEGQSNTLFDSLTRCRVNIFNISKINSEVRGGKAPKIKRLSEYIGQSYFEYLSALPDLVLLMDESHRYRASAGVRAINELKPILGLELTATPWVQQGQRAEKFKNVIFDYPLGQAMDDGFVKEPAVATQKDFNAKLFGEDQLEDIKLRDGIRMHETVKVELETYARQHDKPTVKPFMLVIAKNTDHAARLVQRMESDEFFGGQYKGKIIQVDSSTKAGPEGEDIIKRLLQVEEADEPTEIVVHVEMLKEGWDVTNLYTIVPLRAANTRNLIEQSIGRGLRLPYGKRTGVVAIDRLSIVAHDKFQEIIDEANKTDSPIRMKPIYLDPEGQGERLTTVVVRSNLEEMVNGPGPGTTDPGASTVQSPFANATERQIARAVVRIIKQHEGQPSSASLLNPAVQKQIADQVRETLTVTQLELPGLSIAADVTAIVQQTTQLLIDQSIDIPRISVVPLGEVTTGFNAFKLDLRNMNYQPVERDILVKHLHDQSTHVITAGDQGAPEARPEDHIVRGLMNYDDISYDDHADLLYELAGQVVAHLRKRLDESDTRNVLQYFQKPIAEIVHLQMLDHAWEKAAGYETVVHAGFSELRKSAYTADFKNPQKNFREQPRPLSSITRYVYGGYQRCLYPVSRFQSDPERVLSIILDRDSLKWFKPMQGQFQLYYKRQHEQHPYVPDFVAETKGRIFMLEPKKEADMADAEVLAKKDAAVKWCALATEHAVANGGKPWTYVLIPHTAIAENMSLEGLVERYGGA